ncbi:MAG: DNA repair protein RecN [Eubacterium sp.]|nr:DNA repair protein RecN [Eubacterium sp.]
MITNLHVKNLALIEEADISFRSGLNILTGETGAGKSILMGSIDLALGRKMSADMIRSRAEYALVELVFEISDPVIIKRLTELGAEPEDGVLVLSRKITEGRSLCRLNGETCTASRLRQISPLLLDIHGQHDHQSLLYAERQLAILDAYGKDTLAPFLSETEKAYDALKRAEKEKKVYQVDERERQRELALLEFEIREIEESAVRPGEDEELETEYRRMSCSRTVLEALQRIRNLTGDDGAGDAVGRAIREMDGIVKLDTLLEGPAETLFQIEDLLADFNRDLAACSEEFLYDRETFAMTENRLNRLNELKARYGRTLEDILSYLEKQKERRDQYEQFDENREKAEKAFREAEEDLDRAAEKLTAARKKIAAELAEKISAELEDLNFLSAAFEIGFSGRMVCGRDGRDEISFMIAPNPGEPLRPLSKIASGGELSRIMLAIKTLLADKDSTETLLFDEIDTGVSGRTAQKVAEKMMRIGGSRQVLCITHLAQLAAMADHHFLITKGAEAGNTHTVIEELNEEGSVEELARILGGAEITEAVRENAAEMKALARKMKKE